MKLRKVFVCLLLIIAMCLAGIVDVFAETDSEQDAAYKQYPTVFVHGLLGWGYEDGCYNTIPYWGMGSGSMSEYLESKGYDIAVATVGPISGAWDRCCELFAQLTGTKTDYGAAHVQEALADFAEKGINLDHKRYGRDYTGKAIIKNWGPNIDNKINLVGHSFGGPSVVMFLDLLAKGDNAEREYAQEQAKIYGGDWHDYCSPLFWGDYHGEKLVNSVTSLAGVLNGTTFIDSCHITTQFFMRAAAIIANIAGNSSVNNVYDFRLEQFGLTSSPTTDYTYSLNLIDAYKFLDGKDNAIYDLSIAGCNELKQGWKLYDNVFYFAYAGNSSHMAFGGRQMPNADTQLRLYVFSILMGKYTNKEQVVYDTEGKPYCIIDKKWLSNDGMVNTYSSEYVFGQAHKDWDGHIEPGIWMTMPSYGYDHLDFIGGSPVKFSQKSAQTKAFFDEIMNNIDLTYSHTFLDTPKLGVALKSLLGKFYAQLTWNKIEGADCYRVYKCSTMYDNYKLLDTVSDTSLKDYLIAGGKTYYYKIIAVKNGTPEITSNTPVPISLRVK